MNRLENIKRKCRCNSYILALRPTGKEIFKKYQKFTNFPYTYFVFIASEKFCGYGKNEFNSCKFYFNSSKVVFLGVWVSVRSRVPPIKSGISQRKKLTNFPRDSLKNSNRNYLRNSPQVLLDDFHLKFLQDFPLGFLQKFPKDSYRTP